MFLVGDFVPCYNCRSLAFYASLSPFYFLCFAGAAHPARLSSKEIPAKVVWLALRTSSGPTFQQASILGFELSLFSAADATVRKKYCTTDTVFGFEKRTILGTSTTWQNNSGTFYHLHALSARRFAVTQNSWQNAITVQKACHTTRHVPKIINISLYSTIYYRGLPGHTKLLAEK